MTQPLEKLEARVYQLVQKFETLLGESRRHQLENVRLKIDILTEENRHYRTLLEESAAEIRRLLARLPTKTPSETSPETEK